MDKNSPPGIDALEAIISRLTDSHLFSEQTVNLMKFDILRLKTRIKCSCTRDIIPAFKKLHLGCGSRLLDGWLNVDVVNSDYDVDLACGQLPWRSRIFECIVSQHFIEHLDLISELMPLLIELRRIMKKDGEIWLSCPDIEKICSSYLSCGMSDLFEDSRSRFPDFSLGELPASHMINHLFHQNGEHKNLYDFTLLKWLLKKTGFKNIKRETEVSFLKKFSNFPPRNDDMQTLYIQATA